jgi:hypothetical protein
MSRFVIYVGIAFVTAFVGVSWAMRGFPMWSQRPVTELRPAALPKFGDAGDTEEKRKEREAIAQAESVKDPALDKIRLATLQAANAYSLSPCDKTMKANLVAALTAYTQAWQRVLNCTSSRMLCPDANRTRAAATFSTALDNRVKEAVGKAFEQKGIVKADFPNSVHFDMLLVAGQNLWSDEFPVCAHLAAAGRRP